MFSRSDRPDPPVSLHISDAKRRNVTLNWTPGDDHNSAVIGGGATHTHTRSFQRRPEKLCKHLPTFSSLSTLNAETPFMWRVIRFLCAKEISLSFLLPVPRLGDMHQHRHTHTHKCKHRTFHFVPLTPRATDPYLPSPSWQNETSALFLLLRLDYFLLQNSE